MTNMVLDLRDVMKNNYTPKRKLKKSHVIVRTRTGIRWL